MIVAVIGSRNLTVNKLEVYLPPDTTEIVSGGAKGIDTCAKNFAIKNKIKLTEFLPDYSKYGKQAPLVRNQLIIDYADCVLAFWDGKSRGTKFVINACIKQGKSLRLFIKKPPLV